ncbi:NrfD/PsrC family molybdoenzyme membrane anchor subunit [Thiohalophilus sp.]|uniref:NrfD/PsrC family molybdoenzyme membrane anchor subunit n=1 Tax=Thiohalophilus sp. TaxID=3028392 RepID=UPI002ACDC7FC|nr:NrfD/PsrC family molybdoenzyme membrane anchor subunit [Thiohalophilus sp.]MDZ7662865.1 NrfD/PsrC family molybdoenzyme membrane anchor subunit [Thiohalophilus sp.]
MKNVQFMEIEGRSFGYLALLGILGAIILVALGAWYVMEHHGHYVTGMNNAVVWGTPHIFAIFLIVAASGALNVASISSVFNKTAYKPLARLSGLLAIALLAGGLMILVLDLGRPDRLIIAMTYYNFKSIFAWNIILYNGFFVIVAVYLWMMMQQSMNKYSKPVGVAAFLWRLILTTGTGSIFGFLVARQGYDAAIMAPLFIAMSFSFGLAIFLLVLMAAYKWTGRPLGDALFRRLKNLLGVFVAGVLYFVLAYHLTNLYATEHHGIEAFILRDGGIYPQLFWIGQIVIGSLLPLLLFYHPSTGKNRTLVGLGALLVIIGGFIQLYVLIIGGQAYPLEIFPGKEVIESSFFDGQVAHYAPSIWEVLLGLGGMAVALIMVALAVKILRFMPTSLADEDVDPHHSA